MFVIGGNRYEGFSLLVVATAMGRRGTIVAQMATIGLLR